MFEGGVMANLLLSSSGAALGELWLPPFALRVGESLCLHVPAPAWGEQEAQLLRALTGVDQVAGIVAAGRVEYASPATRRTGLLGLLRQPYAVDWLRRTARLNRDDARRVVAGLGLKPEWRICQIAGTPRALLGLEAVWARGAEGVIFSCVGLDPCGRQAVFEAIRSRLSRCAAVYLSYPYSTQGRQERDHLPGARCLDTGKPGDNLPLPLPA